MRNLPDPGAVAAVRAPWDTPDAMRLRSELLRFPLDDGGLEIVDLVLEQKHAFSSTEADALRALDAGAAPPPELVTRLDSGLLLEGPTAAALREGCRHGRVRSRMPPPAVAEAAGAWGLAPSLPAFVAAAWRDPERWRRLAEDRRAGRRLLRLDGFLAADVAAALRGRVDELPFTQRAAAYAHGDGHDLAGELDDVFDAFRRGPLHTLLGHVMDQALPERIFLRAWRLGPGDDIANHNDGIHYVTTFSLGLTPGWSCRDGGAIAFGYPIARGLDITERWLPHLGDLLLFEPTATAWHLVEAVRAGTRWTVTGHYVSPNYPG